MCKSHRLAACSYQKDRGILMKADLQKTIGFSNNFTKSRHLVRAYMKDVNPGIAIREINILLNVYESGIAAALSQMDRISYIQYSAFISKLESDYGMTTESTIEALNVWMDACIGNHAGIEYGKNIIKEKQIAAAKVNSVAVAPSQRICLGANETIFEDVNIKVKFVRWKRTHYLAGGDALAGYFVFENKSDDRLCIYMKDISIDGFINLAESQTTSLDGKQKEMKGLPFIYENKVPGDLNDFETVEFIICYGRIKDGLNASCLIKGAKNQSNTISVRLK